MAAETDDSINPKSQDGSGDTASKPTVDNLFRLLIRIRGKSPLDARDEIQDALSHDRLAVDMHIAGGARRLLREATAEELERAAEAKQENRSWSWEFLYETLPPEGRTAPVHYSWRHGRIFELVIKDERLVIEPRCAFDFPWESCSFAIADWSVVEELWPRPPSPPIAQVAPSDLVASPELIHQPQSKKSKDWLGRTRKDHPQRANERPGEYAERLHDRMSQDYKKKLVTKVWPLETLKRRLRDRK